MRCYISGPITGVKNYMKNFNRAERHIVETKGWSVINPARVNGELPIDTEYEEYMEMSATMLRLCDCIYMMKGWEHSRGAQFEHTYAKIRGMEIHYEDREDD